MTGPDDIVNRIDRALADYEAQKATPARSVWLGPTDALYGHGCVDRFYPARWQTLAERDPEAAAAYIDDLIAQLDDAPAIPDPVPWWRRILNASGRNRT